ncbi:MAG: shikimate dehydrogenase [Chloroflexi bacterium]|nr:shikimate dehydrogenase [Chloroflexota bacterium]
MLKLILLGFPLTHSLSPAMHNAALDAVGLRDWRYDAMPIESARLSEAVELIRGDEFAGANVTVPHKEKIIPLLDGITPVAEAIGAVNTIVKRDGKIIGHNTDAAGLLADLHLHGVKIQDCVVLVLGAGGSARAAVAACAGMGAKIKIIARRREQAQSLISNLQLPITIYDLTINDLHRASHDCALILNCTPLGMSPNVDSSPWFDSVPFPKESFMYDLVYNPRQTKLVKQARAQGLNADTGLGMLIEQGALAFELWTGKDAPRSLMRESAEQELRDE